MNLSAYSLIQQDRMQIDSLYVFSNLVHVILVHYLLVSQNFAMLYDEALNCSIKLMSFGKETFENADSEILANLEYM